MRPMPDRECGNRTTIIPSPTEWRTGWRLMWGMHRKGRPQGRVALIVAGELQPVLVKLVWSRVLDAVAWIAGAGRDLLRWVEGGFCLTGDRRRS
jgi:hypothetical protein